MTRNEYQQIVNVTSEALKIKTIPVKVKNVIAGHANKNYITLPKWINSYDYHFQVYYAVHETVHYLPGNRQHHEKFKKDEDRALALWHIKIVRKKAYPKFLYCNWKEIKNIPK